MKAAAIRKIERAAARAIERAELPGCVLWVARDGDVVYHAAFGDVEIRPHRRPASTGTVFDLASLTKVLATAFALAKLVEKGALDLAAPVASVYPPFAERDKHKEPITFRHLLTHSAGLKAWAPYHEDVAARDRKRGTRALGTPEALPYVLERIAMSGLIHEVGEASVYGDLGFITLGEIVERVDGRNLCRLFAEDVARPLGLSSTGFIPLVPGADGALSLPKSRIAPTEECPWRERVLLGEVHDPNAWAVGGVAGHAGLFGTAEEVGRVALDLIGCSEGRGSLLSQPVAERFFSRQDLPPGSDWALGWDTPTPGHSTSGRAFSPHSIGHTGFTGTSVWIDLDRRIAIVLLSNRIHPIARKSRFGFRPLIHDLVMEGLGFAPPVEEKPEAPEAPEVEGVAGSEPDADRGPSGSPLP
jgi:CubicO group peptidase (beta-lactamase class C family)